MKLSISLLSIPTLEDKIKFTKKLNNTNIDYLHIDVMDGKFVSQKSFPIKETRKISDVSKKKLDIHLMVNNPEKNILELSTLSNIRDIIIHVEINDDISKLLKLIKDNNIKCGLAISPNTNINTLIPYLDIIDIILVMSVNPGYGGQPFIESSPSRINDIRNIIGNRNIEIEVDGGINNTTINKVKEVNTIVVGSYITKSNNIIERINSLIE